MDIAFWNCLGAYVVVDLCAGLVGGEYIDLNCVPDVTTCTAYDQGDSNWEVYPYYAQRTLTAWEVTGYDTYAWWVDD